MTCPELSSYLNELRRLRRASTTLRQAERWVEGFWVHCSSERGLTRLDQLSAADLESYVQSLCDVIHARGGHFSENSLYQTRQMIRAFLRWAVAAGHMKRDITRGLLLPRPRQPGPDSLSRGQLEQVLAQPLWLHDALALRDQALLKMFCRAGLTRDQAHRLDLPDLQLDARLVRSTPRIQVPLVDDLAEALRRYLEHGRPSLALQPLERALFLTHDGQRLGKLEISDLVRHYGDRAGLRALTSTVLGQEARRALRRRQTSNTALQKPLR